MLRVPETFVLGFKGIAMQALVWLIAIAIIRQIEMCAMTRSSNAVIIECKHSSTLIGILRMSLHQFHTPNNLCPSIWPRSINVNDFHKCPN